MTNKDELTRAEHVERLLNGKVKTLPDWKPPEIIKTIGPFEPRIFDELLAQRNDIIDECREILESYTESEFEELLSSDNIKPNRLGRDWENFRETEIDRLTRSDPAWYAAGFGHPDYVADFEYWSQQAYFTDHEALLLSLGIEPTHFREEELNKMGEKVEKGTELWPTLHYLEVVLNFRPVFSLVKMDQGFI